MATTPSRLPASVAETTAQPGLRKVLLATDFSESTKNALLFALGLARRHRAMLYLLNVVYSIGYFLGGGCVLAQADLQAWRDARRLERELIRDRFLDGVEHEFLVTNGLPSTVIPQIALEKEVDLIVIGTHGRHGLAKLLFGSCAEKVVRSAPCPVLTVGAWMRRSLSYDVGPKRILLLAGSYPSNRHIIEYALSLLARSSTEPISLDVMERSPATGIKWREAETVEPEFRRWLDSVAKGRFPQLQAQIVSTTEGAVEIANRINADLVVITIAESSKAGPARGGVYDTVCASRCPVLAISV